MKNSTQLILLVHNKLAITFLIFCGVINTSYAETAPSVAGKTLLAKGNVTATTSNNKATRILKRRSKIMSVDQINTGNNSKAQFSMADGGLITLKENTEIRVNNYVFNESTQKGSATLEVISGGLRSISGLIKKTGGDYQVKTPVGSIGIRGTHFAVQVDGNDVYFGVYSGNIDITLNNNENLSLGVTEGFAFASVNQFGEVTSFTQAPEVLSKNYTTNAPITSKPQTNTNETSSVNDATTESLPDETTEVSEVAIAPLFLTEDAYTESEWQAINGTPIAELISQRSGSYNYQQLTQSSINSSAGNASNLSLNMAIDFDNGTVPGGSLSLTDAQGEWFATYSGLINVDKLELGVNFASHANKRADGNISAAFSNGLEELTGSFNLNEIEDTSVNTQGSFKLK